MEIVRLLLEYRADPNAVAGSTPHTALQIAARDGCKELVDILLENGADTNSLPAENLGATALQFAAIRGFLGIAYLLLQNGADVNAAASAIKGRTALEGAAEHGRIDMAQLLLNAGASVHGAGQVQYERALSLASKNGHYATRQMLESYHG
ncbi:ankyrin repeat-containing domain protein [Leptodontidium sp. MPI-SDFR-AT-0119]|nr:ankyrin repeat-containing domain protein [Leptodontidium sp. MPI-SDFR-AT-0119]